MPDSGAVVPALFQPFTLRGLTLPNRVVVSPMCQYSCIDGVPNDWHLVHLGSRAIGGAGLVIAEASGVSPIGRISLGCAGIWNEAQTEAWRRITDFVHRQSTSKIGLQLGHAGRKAATKRMWEGPHDPIEGPETWSVIGPSADPYSQKNQVPREMDRADMDQVCAEFVAATKRTIAAGFDMLELHFAHGYLISTFLSPLTNKRTDAYGGDLNARLRYPLEVLDAVRAAMPADMPLSVRISASDMVEGGNTPTEAVAISRALQAHGTDVIDVSSGGQVSYGPIPRPEPLGFVPFARRIKHEVGVATMAVGNINTPQEANGVVEAGDADLVAMARAHLSDPYWTMHAALALGYEVQPWPNQYVAVARQAARQRAGQAMTAR